MSKKRLYVIGNGFDCMYGLPTKVSDFMRHLSEKQVYNETSDANEILNTYGVYWCEFEEGLSYIDTEEIYGRNVQVPDYLSDHESDRDGGILNMQMYTDSLEESVREALDDMIQEAESELDEKECITKLLFNAGDQIVSFNYTSTIERLYDLPEGTNIIHIHGNADGDKIFGYKEQLEQSFVVSSSEEDYYVDKQKEVVNSMYKRLQKNYNDKELEDFLRGNCQEVEEVVVIGHSMSNVDSKYMEMIESVVKPKKWYISQYDQEPSENSLLEYSFADKIKFFDSGDVLI